MRCILSGVEIRRYLSFRTLIAKVVGLTAAFVSGNNLDFFLLFKLPIHFRLFDRKRRSDYSHIKYYLSPTYQNSFFQTHSSSTSWDSFFHSWSIQNDATFLEVLSAACAGGVTLAFGSPIGGALFSIEATSSFYLTSNLWKGFFVSACGAVLLTAVGELGSRPSPLKSLVLIYETNGFYFRLASHVILQSKWTVFLVSNSSEI